MVGLSFLLDKIENIGASLVNVGIEDVKDWTAGAWDTITFWN